MDLKGLGKQTAEKNDLPPAEDCPHEKARLEAERAETVDGASKSLQTGNTESDQSGEDAAEEAAEKVDSQTNERPAFGKHGSGLDENDPLVDGDDVRAEQAIADQLSPKEGAVSIDKLRAVESAEGAPDNSTTYSSHPVSRFKIGRFQFDKGALHLDGDDAAEFEELLSKATPQDQALVKKVDKSAGEAIARSFVESRMNRGVDTTDSRPEAQAKKQ